MSNIGHYFRKWCVLKIEGVKKVNDNKNIPIFFDVGKWIESQNFAISEFFSKFWLDFCSHFKLNSRGSWNDPQILNNSSWNNSCYDIDTTR